MGKDGLAAFEVHTFCLLHQCWSHNWQRTDAHMWSSLHVYYLLLKQRQEVKWKEKTHTSTVEQTWKHRKKCVYYIFTCLLHLVVSIRVQELCEIGGGRPGLPVLMSLTVSVDIKHVPSMSTQHPRTLSSTSSLLMWLCMKWHGAWLYDVHRTCRDGSSFMWHQPCQHCKYTSSVDIQKRAIKSYSLM